ncbi:MAG: hypothetical protein H6619_06005 [Deltaproteobacteria bacterium]|nr:hypothetical protein [Deltaproteobacteria bacterium]
MRKLRVANIDSYTSLPYRLLTNLSSVEYMHFSPTENARMLHEGEVDIAHIPVTEFAIHGGYVGLDFGIAAREKIDAIYLFSMRPLHSLQEIYLDVESNSAVALLRLLLEEKWGLHPKLIRVEHSELLDKIKGHSGALIIGDEALMNSSRYPFAIDLCSAWHELTGLPFVFSVWAARPEILTKEFDSEINEVFHKSLKARESLALTYKDEVALPLSELTTHIVDTLIYHLDSDCLLGMKEFFKRAHKHGILPSEPYRTARFTILHGSAASVKPQKTPAEILEQKVQGKRISIVEACRLAQEAQFTDLALTADLVRSRMFNDRTISNVLELSVDQLKEESVVEKNIAEVVKQGVSRLSIRVDDNKLSDIEKYENLIHNIKTRFAVDLQIFDIPQLISLSRNTGVSVKDISSRFVTVGLSSVNANGSDFLIDRHMKDFGFTSSEWLDAVKWLHRYGVKTSCKIRLASDQTWEERFIHLQKIRALQDETPGFQWFILESDDSFREQNPEDVIRATMISRLFVDNIPFIQESSFFSDPIMGMFNLSFGANDVRVDFNTSDENQSEKLIHLLRSLREIGMDFEQKDINTSQSIIIH